MSIDVPPGWDWLNTNRTSLHENDRTRKWRCSWCQPRRLLPTSFAATHSPSIVIGPTWAPTRPMAWFIRSLDIISKTKINITSLKGHVLGSYSYYTSNFLSISELPYCSSPSLILPFPTLIAGSCLPRRHECLPESWRSLQGRIRKLHLQWRFDRFQLHVRFTFAICDLLCYYQKNASLIDSQIRDYNCGRKCGQAR